MDKKKIKKIQMRYPAPYSQSWSTPLVKKPKKVASAALAANPKVPKHMPTESSDWLKRKSVCMASDPAAPHLKYGVFRNKRPVARIQPRLNSDLKSLKYENNMTSERSIKLNKIKKTIRKELADQLSDFCPINKHSSKLTKSEVKHLDIKPRPNSTSPGSRVTYNIRPRPRRTPTLSPVSRFIMRGD